MNKKQLPTEAIKNELEGSVFFPSVEERQQSSSPPVVPAVEHPQPAEPTASKPARQRASKRESAAASKLAPEQASTLASYPEPLIEAIRSIVKDPGREVAFTRLSADEKAQLADVVYTYKRQGTRTTENEIIRIAVNTLLADYRDNGETSVLARVLDALKR